VLHIKFSGGRQFSSPKPPTPCSCKPIESNTLRLTVFPFKISEIWRGFKADFRFKLWEYYKMYRPKIWLFEGQKIAEKYSERSLEQILKKALLKARIAKR